MKLYEIPFTPAYSDVTRITSFNGVKLSLSAKMIYLFMVGLQRNGQEVFPQSITCVNCSVLGERLL